MKNYASLFNKADKAGYAAAAKVTPAPMLVAQHASPLDDRSPVTQSWVAPGGVCGFAWVVVRGNNGLVRWAKTTGRARPNYYGGTTVKTVFEFGQSLAKKEAYAAAFAATLRAAGFDASAESRLD